MALGFPPPSPVGSYAPLTPITMSAGIDLNSSRGGGSYSPPHNLSPKGSSSSANVNGYNSQVQLYKAQSLCRPLYLFKILWSLRIKDTLVAIVSLALIRYHYSSLISAIHSQCPLYRGRSLVGGSTIYIGGFYIYTIGYLNFSPTQVPAYTSGQASYPVAQASYWSSFHQSSFTPSCHVTSKTPPFFEKQRSHLSLFWLLN